MIITYKKIAIITALCMIVTLSMPINSKAATVSDISGHWANTTIQSWVDKDFISGYPDGSFRPDNNISRAEFMTIINKSFGFTSQAGISYSDVNVDDWYFGAVAAAQAAGYISGYPDGTMRPDNPISREEVATIIMKIKKLQENSDAANIFSDAMHMTWSKGAIGAVAKAGIMKGYPNGGFIPQNKINRGEAVVALDDASKYVPMAAAPLVTRDDEKNTVSGMLTTMEYKLDSANWTAYYASAFSKIDFSGNHTLMVRFAAVESTPFSQSTTLTFTTNAVISGGGGGGGGGGNPVTNPVTGVSLDNTSINLTAGGLTGSITATVSPSAATNKTVTWTSDNESVATVSAGGVVTPKASGTAIITAITADGGFTATCTVTVNPAPATVEVTGVNLDKTVMTLTTGGLTGTIMATVSPSDATNKSVVWTSGNPSVATVADGVVTLVSYGTALITATTVEGGFNATCLVTVADLAKAPTVIFSGARITQGAPYFKENNIPEEEVEEIEKVLWGDPEASPVTIAGVYVESGLYSTSGGALVIDANKITQSLLDWLYYRVWTDGKMAIEITSSNGQGFLMNSNIENTDGSTALSGLTVIDDNWEGTIIRVDLDDLESTVNDGKLLMDDGTTKADFQVIVINNLTHPTLINITSSSQTIWVDGDTLQMNSEVLPSNAYDKIVKWVVDDGDPTDTNEVARISVWGTIYALKNGAVTVTAISADTGMVSDPFLVTITGQVGPATPSGIGKTDETAYGKNDGTLTGVASGQEYQLNGAGSWTTITGTTITGLAPGSYTVRVAETGTAPAGFETASLVIMPGPIVPAGPES